jgi:hypothetical protein
VIYNFPALIGAISVVLFYFIGVRKYIYLERLRVIKAAQIFICLMLAFVVEIDLIYQLIFCGAIPLYVIFIIIFNYVRLKDKTH